MRGRVLAAVALLGGAAALLAGPEQAPAQERLSGLEIMRRADRANRSRDEKLTVDVVLSVGSGADERRERRTMEIYTWTDPDGEDDKSLVRFLEPPTVRGTALLTHETTGAPDDQWVYLPALRQEGQGAKARKIASSQRTQRFAQTDFTYEDLRTEELEANRYERKDDARVGEDAVFVVEATPTDPERSGYSKRLLYIDQGRWVPHRIEFFDAQGRHQKTLENRGWTQVQGLWRAELTQMQDLQRGSRTLWRTSDRKVDPGLPDNFFTVITLERGL